MKLRSYEVMNVIGSNIRHQEVEKGGEIREVCEVIAILIAPVK